MEFKERQYDGPYEVSAVEIDINGQLLRGLLYFPAEPFNKPFPLITYFHDFPQLFSLKQIVRNYGYLLEIGFSFLIFNFRGYRFSEGEISLKSQLLDSLKIIEFIQLMGKKKVFKIQNINILAHGFGSYIALLLCSKVNLINKILLLSPIIDLERHVNSEDFLKSLQYINRFLPGNVRGIENIPNFIEKTKSELNNQKYNIKYVMPHFHFNKLKIIIGELDKITPLNEVKELIHHLNNIDIKVIPGMDHDYVENNDDQKINKHVKMFFST